MKYFGILKEQLSDKFDYIKMYRLLENNNIFEKTFTHKKDEDAGKRNSVSSIVKKAKIIHRIPTLFITLVKEDIAVRLTNKIERPRDLDLQFKITDDEFTLIKPTQNLKDDFYSFLIELKNVEIMDDFFLISNEFEEKIFGLKVKKHKDIALKTFKEKYLEIFDDNLYVFPENDSDNDVDEVNFPIKISKIEFIDLKKTVHIKKLISLTSFNHYLKGNLKYFEKEFSLENKAALEDFIIYESRKQFLNDLNDKYSFSKKTLVKLTESDKIKFKEYKHIFNSIEAYQFSHLKIISFKRDKKAQIESLWEVLRINNLTNKKKKTFYAYLLKEHNIAITKIISYINYDKRKDFKEPNCSHYEHDERVKLFHTEWDKFITHKLP